MCGATLSKKTYTAKTPRNKKHNAHRKHFGENFGGIIPSDGVGLILGQGVKKFFHSLALLLQQLPKGPWRPCFFFEEKKRARFGRSEQDAFFFDKGLILCKQKVVVTSSCLGFSAEEVRTVSHTLGRHAKDFKDVLSQKHV